MLFLYLLYSHAADLGCEGKLTSFTESVPGLPTPISTVLRVMVFWAERHIYIQRDWFHYNFILLIILKILLFTFYFASDQPRFKLKPKHCLFFLFNNALSLLQVISLGNDYPEVKLCNLISLNHKPKVALPGTATVKQPLALKAAIVP